MSGIIGITMGDPLGIGPEVVVKALGERVILRRDQAGIAHGTSRNAGIHIEGMVARKYHHGWWWSQDCA